jgi:hypothetical protein
VSLGVLATVPIARSSDAVQAGGVRVAAAAVVALVAALVLGWSPLVPVAIVLVASTYAAQLAVDDAPLDAAAPLLAAGLLVVAELAYWSLEERAHVPGEAGAGLRHSAVVAALGATALLVALLVLLLVDAVRTTGLAIDVLGAAAAAAVLLAIVLFAARGHVPREH